MNPFFESLNRILIFSGSLINWLLGGFDSLIFALIAFTAMDTLSVVLLGVTDKRVTKKIGIKSISKKMMMFVLASLGNIIDQHVIGYGSSLRTMIILFYLSNEGINIIGNAGKMGLPLPDKLKEAIHQLNVSDNKK
ncbi:phage holin family protein [Caproiciproducens galactitolivorans]|uniref:Holin family protein n=1 Tax=Caproiciproducens galactitolivorans TaxID=642589 RepID=A0A4Z0XZN2_9FIRM|nr:phage holin family protein [Caproiciproducens galactitolivorans]QEY34747.1 phage holin family protein [Caproiciproducens galactitolivorans]TGJ76007.1 holin family protein [Caproiciproducens galactitolivorans]